ncbi:MAG: zf-HC2 domain-containing protein [Clostridia bacterium]|nr:zf-HC2 domain-containing protein [Clostridia bacterium]
MKSECDVVRDLLPLYADDVCSPTSREVVEAHLKTCPDCARVLSRLRQSELEDDLHYEKDEVIHRQAVRFKRRSARVGSVIACILMVPVLISLILEMTVPAFTPLIFLVVLSSIAVLGSLIVTPLMVERDKLFWTFLTFTASLIVLLFFCFLQMPYTFTDFLLVISSVLFGLSVVFLPFLIRARPLRPYLERCNKAAVVVITDVILFANMMNLVPFYNKNPLQTLFVFLLCAGAMTFMIVSIMQRSRRK